MDTTWIVLRKSPVTKKWGILLQTEHEEYVTVVEEIAEEYNMQTITVRTQP